MRKVAEYLGWVIAFILGVSLTPLGWLPSALNLEPMEWLVLVCGMALVFAYLVCRGTPEKQ